MENEFKWPASIPSGQRTYKTPSCLIRKTIKSIELKSSKGEVIDLFDENNGFDDLWRLIIISGAIGVFCGVKNSLYAGYVIASRNNRPPTFEYKFYDVNIKWVSESKKDILCSNFELMDIVTTLANIVEAPNPN